MSTTQSAGLTHTRGAVLPDRYIAHPNGDLRSDTANPGIFIDERDRRYMQINGDWYGVTRGKNEREANGTWRVIVHDEPAKPGVPVKHDAGGQWTLHGDVRLQGGHRSAVDKANLQASLQATRSALQCNHANGALTLQELGDAERELMQTENDLERAAMTARVPNNEYPV
jgi:hypothetical protein